MTGREWLISVAVPLVTIVLGGGLLLGLLKLPSDRRHMAAATQHENAQAADLLTGKALEMVDRAQREAEDATARAIRAEEVATQCRMRAEQAEERAAESARTSVECAAEVMRITGVIHTYEDFILAKGYALPSTSGRGGQ